jgi:hypothetical protein
MAMLEKRFSVSDSSKALTKGGLKAYDCNVGTIRGVHSGKR